MEHTNFVPKLRIYVPNIIKNMKNKLFRLGICLCFLSFINGPKEASAKNELPADVSIQRSVEHPQHHRLYGIHAFGKRRHHRKCMD